MMQSSLSAVTSSGKLSGSFRFQNRIGRSTTQRFTAIAAFEDFFLLKGMASVHTAVNPPQRPRDQELLQYSPRGSSAMRQQRSLWRDQRKIA